MQIDLVGMSMSYNVVTTYLLFVYIIKYLYLRKEKFDFTIARPLLLFYIPLILLTLIPRELPFSEQFPWIRAEFMNVAFVPIVIWNIFKSEKDLRMLYMVIIISATIMSFYGLYCFVTSSNPYITFLDTYFGRMDFVSVYLTLSRSGFQGRVQSTTPHPMAWAAVLFMFIYFIRLIYTKQKKSLYQYFLLSLFIINLLLCGTRSGLFAFILGTAYLFYFLSKKKIKIAIICIITFFFLIELDTSVFGKYQEYADSFVGVFSNQKQTTGSSVEMRMEQFYASLKLIETRDVFIGRGFNWTQLFIKKLGFSSAFRGFESVFIVVFIENGIIGCLIWTFFFISLLYLNRKVTINKNLREERLYLNAFIYSYIAFILITGLCQTFIPFMLLYTIMLKHVDIKDGDLQQPRLLNSTDQTKLPPSMLY